MAYKRDAIRWRTRFGSWVGSVTVSAIVSHLQNDPDLRVTNNAVYQWLKGHPPTVERARALVELSRGALSYEAIYTQRQEIEEITRQCESSSGSTDPS